jgi:Skp family chaperone for outer membrane proteins|tara:strand:+ start:1633 stop:1767 length:135 start_codon:yes stop_codon:yes gene_type:complete
MTEEEVKALIQELRDEIPAIVQKLNDDLKEQAGKDYQKYLEDNK